MSAPVTAPGPSAVLAWRAQRQHLAARAPRDDALDVVRDISGLHAQLTSSAEFTLWARVDRLERDAVSRALWEDRTLVKTWAMRGTLHLMPADELRLWVGAQSALKPRHHGGAWLRHHGLTREQAEAMLDAIPVALDGRQLTREELAAEVARVTGDRGARRQAQGRLRRPAQAGGVPRRPLFRAPRRPARAFRAARSVARPVGADGDGRGDARGRAPIPGALRPRHPRHVGALVRDALARRGRPLAEAARRRSGGARRLLPARRRRRRARIGGADRRGAAPAGLRPVRGRRAAGRRRCGRSGPSRARVPPAGVGCRRYCSSTAA